MRISRADFKHLEGSRPRLIHGSHYSLAVYALPAPMQGPKVACVASKKVSRSAVVRNSVERRCKAVVKDVLTNCKEYALVFRAKKSASEASFAECVRDIRSLIERIR